MAWPSILVAEASSWIVVAFILTVSAWFIFLNFFTDEMSHPLDFYSILLRTRPKLFAGILLFFVVASLILIFGPFQDLINTLPELAAMVNIEGLIIATTIFQHDSAAAAVIALPIYVFAALINTMIVLIPTIGTDRPGILYAIGFLALNMLWVGWLRVGLSRRRTGDRLQKLLPEGSDSIPVLWVDAVLRGNPIIIFIDCLFYGLEYLLEVEEFGYACALVFALFSIALLRGCCREFRSGTEMGDPAEELS